MTATTTPQVRNLRPAEAAKKLSIGLSTLWLKVKTQPGFPKPYKLGPATTVFFENELDEYLVRCAASRSK